MGKRKMISKMLTAITALMLIFGLATGGTVAFGAVKLSKEPLPNHFKAHPARTNGGQHKFNPSKSARITLAPSNVTKLSDTPDITTRLAITPNAVTLTQTLSIPVLCYHHIVINAVSDEEISLSKFKEHMSYLKTNSYTPITLDQLNAYLTNSVALPEKPVLITFDDGWSDQYTNALPVLNQNNFKATFFIVGETLTWSGSDYMTKANVVELKRLGYDIAAHTWTHGDLTKLSNESNEAFNTRMNTELKQTKDVLESAIGSPVIAIAYPYGTYDKASVQAASGYGYKLGFTVNESCNVKGGQSNLLLKRFALSKNITTTEFAEQLKSPTFDIIGRSPEDGTTIVPSNVALNVNLGDISNLNTNWIQLAVDFQDVPTTFTNANGQNVVASKGTVNLTPGFHFISLWADDKNGNFVNSCWGVMVTAGATPLTVTITSPASGSTVKTATPTLSYSFNKDVAETTVAVDGAPVTTRSGGVLALLPEGKHLVEVTATDLAGNKGSASSTFTVDTIAPTVIITSPASGSTTSTVTPYLFYTVNENAQITVTVDSKVVTTRSGGKLDSLSNGTHKVIVTATDIAGNTGSASTSFTVAKADTTAPTVSSSDPANKATKVAINKKTFTVTFNEPIQKGAAFSSITFKPANSSGKQVTFVSSISGNTVTLSLGSSNMSSKTNYNIVLPANAVKDVAGNNASKYTLTFKTK